MEEVMVMKKLITFVITSIVVLMLTMLVFRFTKKPAIIKTPDLSTSVYNSAANNWQYRASVWMGVCNSKLYFIPTGVSTLSQKKYEDWLCTLDDGKIKRLIDLQDIDPEIIGLVNNNLYVQSWPSQKAGALYCINLSGMERKELFSFSQMPERDGRYARFLRNVYFAENKTLYLPILPEHLETPHFLHVSGESVLGVSTIPDEYFLGDYKYSLEMEYGSAVENVIRTGADGVRETLNFDPALVRFVIPTEDGLLIHNQRPFTSKGVLYYIDESGSITELFSVPQLQSESVVTIYGDEVFLSLKRWEDWGEIGMRRYDDDAVEGTYRISLSDYSVEKISDKIYNGLYIFDDTGIYACDETSNIFKLDFDGNLVETVLSWSQQP